jgi:hypothetical protein
LINFYLLTFKKAMMRKNIESLVQRVDRSPRGFLQGGFGSIRGGGGPTQLADINTGVCTNSGSACWGTNSGSCTNANNCTVGDNPGSCTNSSVCFD